MRPSPASFPLLLLLLASAPAAGQPQQQQPPVEADETENEPKRDSISLLGNRFSLVGGVAMLWPVSRETREVFGSNHLSPSLAFWTFRSHQGFSFSLDLAWRSFGEDAGEASIWAANAGVVWLARHRIRNAIPYLALRAGPAIVDLPEREARFGLGGTLEAGVVLWRRLIVSGRYDALTRAAGFDLSSFSARVALRLF
jgi:hypothetical protein